ncbi:MAG: polysaccharide deacetylase [Clostridiaceae bacterium]|nr:polysaccharide deacetylase [Clostridiaceae bacterium]
MKKKFLLILIPAAIIFLLCSSMYISHYHHSLFTKTFKNNIERTTNNPSTKENTTPQKVVSNTTSEVNKPEEIINHPPDIATTQVKDRPLYEKEVFLTFDDGPSNKSTLKILDILKENDVQATFFVVGKMAEQNSNNLKAIHDMGMDIENHSYSHDYKMYNSIESCIEDFNKCDAVLKELINKDPSQILRFPGGSDNGVSKIDTMASIRKYFKDNGNYYIDWNVSSTDAAPILVPTAKIVERVTEMCKNRKFVVILMHDVDSKTTTLEALPIIIKYLKEQGFVFRTFNDITPTEENELVKLKIANR